LHVEVPPFDEARLTEAALNQLVPIEYHADAVVLFDIIYDKKKPVFGTIFEVQRMIGPEGVPQVTDRDQAVREPQLAVLSVVAHGGGEVETAVPIVRAAIDAVLRIPEEQRLLYSALIAKALSEAARKALEMEPQIVKFFSDAQRRSYDLAKPRGKPRAKPTRC
jgi:hypothetical protein